MQLDIKGNVELFWELSLTDLLKDMAHGPKGNETFLLDRNGAPLLVAYWSDEEWWTISTTARIGE